MGTRHSESGKDEKKEAEVVDTSKQERQQLMAEVDERKRKILRDVEVLCSLITPAVHHVHARMV